MFKLGVHFSFSTAVSLEKLFISVVQARCTTLTGNSIKSNQQVEYE